jgi:Rrf2 family protein
MNTLAQQPDGILKSTASLATELDIPLPFLHQIAHTLMQQGLIHAVPGPHGGLGLNKEAKDITIFEIAVALEGEIKLAPCSETNAQCPREENCITRWVWENLQDEVSQKLQSIHLNMLTPAA